MSGTDFWFYLIEPGTFRIVPSDDPRIRSALLDPKSHISLLDIIGQTMGEFLGLNCSTRRLHRRKTNSRFRNRFHEGQSATALLNFARKSGSFSVSFAGRIADQQQPASIAADSCRAADSHFKCHSDHLPMRILVESFASQPGESLSAAAATSSASFLLSVAELCELSQQAKSDWQLARKLRLPVGLLDVGLAATLNDGSADQSTDGKQAVGGRSVSSGSCITQQGVRNSNAQNVCSLRRQPKCRRAQ